MDRDISTVALFVFLVANMLLQSAYGTTYTVGDSTGWVIPIGNDDFYDDWADNKIFMVGDVLVFNFTTGQHNVAEVTEASYDACNTANPISTASTGPARITLNRTGEYHFICAFPNHCSSGQKLNIEVRSGSGTGPAPTPRPSPTPGGRTYSVGDASGWRVPVGNDDLYDDWNDNKIFHVGDVLVFNFTTGQHDVAEVTEADYDACNTANPISTVSTGPAMITLNRTGDHYFICAFPGHCSAGQKLEVEVRSGSGTGPAPTPRPSPTPAGRTYTVGDASGWRVPVGNDDLYDDWNDNKIFHVGDVLVFNFTTGQHDVAEVTEADYDACNTANPISTVSTGPAMVTLNRTGDHYFICAFPGHCSAGQKLEVEVRSGSGTGPAPTPRPSPTPAGRTYTVGDASGWRVPVGNDDLYDDWNDNKIFHVGDVLVFNFTTGQHDVAEVTEADYDACNTANPIYTLSTGPARITLNRTGDHYFICAFPNHCSAGQKLEIEVRSSSGTGPVPTPSPTTPGTPSGTPTGRTYTVGDSTGWIVPVGNDDFYDDWADNKEFAIGDVLVFNFTNGQHNVVEVTEAGYDSCSTSNAISTVSTGPARITLNRTGDHYFICGFPNHCASGQKLEIEVHRTSAAPGVPGTPGSSTPGAGTSGPPGSNSASSPVATVFLVLFMSFALALF